MVIIEVFSCRRVIISRECESLNFNLRERAFFPRNVDMYLDEVLGVTSQKFFIHLLRLIEDNVLRRMFGPKRKEMMGEWRKFYETTFPPLVFLTNICHLWLLAILLQVNSCTVGWNFSVFLRQS
jgi:hypothetical protein